MIYLYILQITIMARKCKNNTVRFVVTSRDLLKISWNSHCVRNVSKSKMRSRLAIGSIFSGDTWQEYSSSSTIENPCMKDSRRKSIAGEVRWWLATVFQYWLKLLSCIIGVFSPRVQTRARLGDRLPVPVPSRSWWSADFARPETPLSPGYTVPANQCDPGLWLRVPKRLVYPYSLVFASHVAYG